MESLDGYFSYDELLVEPFREHGWNVELVPWRGRDPDWESFDAVLIRTPWDYYQDPDRFVSVLSEIDRVTRLENPLDVVKWNLDKRYLLDLEARGIAIVPTILLDRLSPEQTMARARDLGSDEIIVKPVVGANAEHARRIHLDRLDPESLAHVDSGVWLLQPFIASVIEEGEASLFYFGGTYSHAITKRPAAGDFRVQEEHGGALASITPPPDLLEAGNAAIEAIGKTLLYARVDLVRHENRWLLMELELIEPSLYFNMDPDSPARFARAFSDWMHDPDPEASASDTGPATR